MGLLNNLGEWLGGMLQAGAGVSVSYARAAGGSALAPTVWVGRSALGTDTTAPRYMQWGERDYLVLASDLTVSGAAVEPRIGDRLTETINGVSHVFEVCSDGAGEHWRWSDPGRTMYRLHTKRVS